MSGARAKLRLGPLNKSIIEIFFLNATSNFGNILEKVPNLIEDLIEKNS